MPTSSLYHSGPSTGLVVSEPSLMCNKYDINEMFLYVMLSVFVSVVKDSTMIRGHPGFLSATTVRVPSSPGDDRFSLSHAPVTTRVLVFSQVSSRANILHACSFQTPVLQGAVSCGRTRVASHVNTKPHGCCGSRDWMLPKQLCSHQPPWSSCTCFLQIWTVFSNTRV